MLSMLRVRSVGSSGGCRWAASAWGARLVAPGRGVAIEVAYPVPSILCAWVWDDEEHHQIALMTSDTLKYTSDIRMPSLLEAAC